jgi:hypothetical protein
MSDCIWAGRKTKQNCRPAFDVGLRCRRESGISDAFGSSHGQSERERGRRRRRRERDIVPRVRTNCLVQTERRKDAEAPLAKKKPFVARSLQGHSTARERERERGETMRLGRRAQLFHNGRDGSRTTLNVDKMGRVSRCIEFLVGDN